MNDNKGAMAVPVEPLEDHAQPSAQEVLFGCASISGRREQNEDVVMAAEVHVPQNRPLAIITVADGLGAHGNGDKAAAEVTKGFFAGLASLLLFRDPGCGELSLSSAIWKAMCFCNEWLMSYAKSLGDDVEMGTTLVAGVLDGPTLYLSNVGDSRGYRWRRGVLEQLTRDNSSVQFFVDQGVLTPEQAEIHPWSNEITRALGWPDALDELVVAPHPVEPGDVILLCSDGLWKGSNGLIQRHLDRLCEREFDQSNLDESVQELVLAALERGSDDNISASVLWVAPDTTTAEVLALPQCCSDELANAAHHEEA